MMFLLSSITIIIAFLSEIILINGNHNEVVSVTTRNGQINGRRKVVFGKKLNEFLSIPYAKPPVGNLRFKKPEPVENWSNPINATQLPDPCYQIPLTDTFLNNNFSEDCLYLNVWQPISDNSPNELKSVMFFIHGGGLLEGSSSEYQFQGQILSTKGDVVLVTINYRVSSFGFLYTGTDDAPGNVGLWDNVMALKWVRDNIRSFGGDPNQITIFGQSGGSWAVSAHILSPISRNLYKQAILMSGAYTSIFIASSSQSKELWLNGSKLIGCATDSDNSFNTRIINCLLNVNASLLATIPFLPDILGNIIGIPPMGVIDGIFLPSSPTQMLESGNYKKNINLMFGSVEDEGAVILALLQIPGYGVTSPGNFTYYQSYANLIDFVSRVSANTIVDAQQAARLYFAEISPNNRNYDFLRRTVGIAIGDFILGCQTKVFAETVFKFDRRNSNVYEYYYLSKLGTSVYFCAPWMGACHGADLSPLFGLPFIYYNNYTDAQRKESVQVIEFFSHFGKYGYPLPQNGIDWPKYYSLNGNIVTPYLQINTNRSYFGYGLKITECEYLWKKYLYVNVPN